MSPKNRMTSGYNSWGNPPLSYSHTMNISNYTYTQTGVAVPNSANFVKFSIPSSSTGTFNIEISRTLTNCSVYYIHTVYHNSVTDMYTFSNAIWGNPGTAEINIDANNVDEIYLIIVNPNDAGHVSYLYTAELNS